MKKLASATKYETGWCALRHGGSVLAAAANLDEVNYTEKSSRQVP
jgi:hypothetical protein